jgi:hypothetical protein
MPTALDNGQRSPRRLLRAVIARLLGRVSRQRPQPCSWLAVELTDMTSTPASGAPRFTQTRRFPR